MISVLIITKNEEDVIEDCIKSVKGFADEILVIDGGSTDKTVQIAEKQGAKVIKNNFESFSDQRNLALSKAKYDWVFYIDSDERATEPFVKELIENITTAPETLAGFFVKRKTYFYGKDWKFQDRVERVFRKDKIRKWYGKVHETPEVLGSMADINEPILHFTHRNFEQMIRKTNSWSEYEADARFKSDHPKMTAWRFPRVMISAFFDSYLGQGGYKNGTAGVVEAMYQAFSMFITYAKLWEKQEEKK